MIALFLVLAVIPFLRQNRQISSTAYDELDAIALTLIENPPAIDLLTGERLGAAAGARNVLGNEYKFRVEHPGYFPRRAWSVTPTLPAAALLLAPTAREAYRRAAWKNPTGPRLIVLQFDGMTPALVERYRGEGLLPALETLLERGVGGRLASCCDLSSPPIWTTVNTGLTPADHGIDGFLKTDPQTGDLLDYGPADVWAPRLWDIARARGMSAALAGVFLVEPREDLLHDQGLARGRLLFAQWRTAASPDVAVIYIKDADEAGHLYWSAAEPDFFRAHGWPLSEPRVAFHRERLRQAYLDLDAWTALALTLAGPDTTILLVSDHGMRAVTGPPQPVASAQKLVTLLNRHVSGLTPCDRNVNDTLRLCAKPGTDLAAAKTILEKVILKDGQPIFTGVSLEELAVADDGEPAHILMATLAANVLSAERRPTDSFQFAGRRLTLADLLDYSPPISGVHEREGVYFLAGAGVRPGSAAREPSVYDVMPTALAILGLPAGADMPGRVWTECLENIVPEPRIASYGRLTAPPSREAPTAEVIRRLKSLQYIQ